MQAIINNLKEAYDMIDKIDNGNLSMGCDGCYYYFDKELIKILKEDIKSYYKTRIEQYKKLLKEQL